MFMFKVFSLFPELTFDPHCAQGCRLHTASAVAWFTDVVKLCLHFYLSFLADYATLLMS